MTALVHKSGNGDSCADPMTFVTPPSRRIRAFRERLEELVAERTRDLEESREALHRADRLASPGTFAAGLAHELNNPLGMMLLRADEAMLDSDKDLDTSAALVEIKQQIARCAEIVANVLRFSRGGETAAKVVDLAAIVPRAVSLAKNYFKNSRVEIVTEVGTKPSLALGNEIELEQVIVNLLNNALAASSSGSSVTVALAQTDWLLRLSVRDTGVGMTDQALDHAYDPFYTTKRAEGGGLGSG